MKTQGNAVKTQGKGSEDTRKGSEDTRKGTERAVETQGRVAKIDDRSLTVVVLVRLVAPDIAGVPDAVWLQIAAGACLVPDEVDVDQDDEDDEEDDNDNELKTRPRETGESVIALLGLMCRDHLESNRSHIGTRWYCGSSCGAAAAAVSKRWYAGGLDRVASSLWCRGEGEVGGHGRRDPGTYQRDDMVDAGGGRIHGDKGGQQWGGGEAGGAAA